LRILNDEVVNIVVVDLGAVVDGRVGNMAPHVVDDVHGAIALGGRSLPARRGLALLASLSLVFLTETVEILENNFSSVDV
jgi:hypothetical protein